MGKYGRGAFGRFFGKMGNLVGSKWKNVDYMRMKPDRKPTSFSDAQLDQQLRFKTATDFVGTFTPLTAWTFRSFNDKMTGYNRALQYILKNAITGTNPNYAINYSMALIGEGDLPEEPDAKAVAATNGVTFTWTYSTSDVGLSQPTDKAVLLVYCEALKRSVFTLKGADRSAGTATLNVPHFKGQVVQTWITFISADAREVATSLYTGAVTIA